MISKVQVLITWVQYVIAEKDKKDEVISTFKSPFYVTIGKKNEKHLTSISSAEY
jgi:hypothetical protein